MRVEKIIQTLKDSREKSMEYLSDDLNKLLGESELVHEEGNSEGGGEYSELVRYFKEHNVYIKQTGVYYSYNGTDWNGDYHEVKPTQKTITVYE